MVCSLDGQTAPAEQAVSSARAAGRTHTTRAWMEVIGGQVLRGMAWAPDLGIPTDLWPVPTRRMGAHLAERTARMAGCRMVPGEAHQGRELIDG
jgi:hypothetical protein